MPAVRGHLERPATEVCPTVSGSVGPSPMLTPARERILPGAWVPEAVHRLMDKVTEAFIVTATPGTDRRPMAN